jgi:hypothetical protein
LRFIVLAATGQDVSRCKACEGCDVKAALKERFDLPLWEVLTATCQDDEAALTNRTIRALAEACPEAVDCLQGLDIVAIARALCREAELRGLAPQPAERR